MRDAIPDAENPFAARAMPSQTSGERTKIVPGPWRDGKKLVLHKWVGFPPLCVKSGRPAQLWIPRGFAHYKFDTLCFLLALVFPAAVALPFLLPRTVVQIPLTKWAQFLRSLKIAFAIALFIGSIVALFSAMVYRKQFLPMLLLLLASQLQIVVAIFLGLSALRILRASRVTPELVWFKGVHASILEPLAPWDPRYEKEYLRRSKRPGQRP